MLTPTVAAARRLCVAAAAFVLGLAAGTAPAAAGTDLLDEIAAGWRTDPVYVHPPMRAGFPAAELARIRAAAGSAGMPVYVALVPDGSALRETWLEMPLLLHGRVGRDGLYLVWIVDDDRWHGAAELVLPPGRDGDRLLGQARADDKAQHDLRHDTPAPTLVRRIQQARLAADRVALPPVPRDDLDEYATRGPRGPSTTDLEDRAVLVGAGVGGVAGIALTIWFGLRHRPTRDGPGPDRRSRPATVTVRGLHSDADSRLVRATRSVRALERRIDRARPGSGAVPELLARRDDADLRLEAAWLLRNLDRADVRTAAGAAVLAEQGHRVAIADRPGGQGWTPCFFDPTHTGGIRRTSWSEPGGGGTGAYADVPACRRCAKAIDDGDDPDSLLVPVTGLFGRHRADVPYWTRDPADDIFSATGFGALSDDLAERVRATYGGAG